MARFLIIGMLFFGAGCTAQNTDPSKWKTGQVLSEQIKNLGAGFQLVSREVVNPPEFWEGVGHFSFIYFHDRQLCQCDEGDLSISPSKRNAVFKDGPTGKLFLFNVTTGHITEVTKKYIGSPQSFIWNEEEGLVTVNFYQNLNNGYENSQPLPIQFE